MLTRTDVRSARGYGSLRTGLTVILLMVSAAAGAQEAVPPALHGWEGWVLHGHETHRCPWLAPGRAFDEERICAWWRPLSCR